MEGLERARGAFSEAARDLIGAEGMPVGNLGEVEMRADCGVRFELFRLATHYWEGRWILAMEACLRDSRWKPGAKGRKFVEPRWRRWMMLTPCMVSTFASLPGQMTVSRFVERDRFETEYLFNFIDLLIVDEAGQVQPETAGGVLSLARRALVIGDTLQIEPISSLPKSVDIGNLLESGVVTAAAEEDLEKVDDLGVCCAGGSAMLVAQSACRYHPEPELNRGLWLFEHRRCFDEIIRYCNLLCYKGKLEAKRGSAFGRDGQGPVVGPLGYVHVDGFCTSAGGSRRNVQEAEAIAQWLSAQRGLLEERYSVRLEEIVGVVTPFGAQVRAIRDACRKKGIVVDVSGKSAGSRGGPKLDPMTVGTVHALQGADRKVVVFSGTYSKHADGAFIDMSPSMLNVAVSRAKDAFVVFGDMDLLAGAGSGTPRRLLGDFLFAERANELDFALEFDDLQREDLVASGEVPRMLRDAAEHDAFLKSVLSEGGFRKISIVSPWIVVDTVEKSGVAAALRQACGGNVSVEVYVDPELSAGSADGGVSNLERARAMFEEMGVGLKEVSRLHSKIVMGDEQLLCVGSFNWLSAQRSGKYARHETSVVYRGSQLADEIGVVCGSLLERAA